MSFLHQAAAGPPRGVLRDHQPHGLRSSTLAGPPGGQDKRQICAIDDATSVNVAEAVGWQWIRVMTPFINAYAALFLVGGAVWSCHRFWGVPGQRSRTLGTALIAVGGILPGIGGSMAKAGTVEALYVAELVGLILIWAGYAACIRAPGSWSSGLR